MVTEDSKNFYAKSNERVRQVKGKCEGRKPHVELRPEAASHCFWSRLPSLLRTAYR